MSTINCSDPVSIFDDMTTRHENIIKYEPDLVGTVDAGEYVTLAAMIPHDTGTPTTDIIKVNDFKSSMDSTKAAVNFCSLCKVSFTTKAHLTRHNSNVHNIPKITNPDSSKRFHCEECNIKFSKKSSLTRHNLKLHRAAIVAKQDSRKAGKFFCLTCDVSFSEKSSLKRHNHKKHNLETVTREKSENAMPNVSTPELSVTPVKLTFSSMEEFEKWKCETEKSTKSSFVASRGAKRLANGNIAYYYNCHRSGHYKPKVPGSSCRKVQGSNKIGGRCNASIKALRNENMKEIQVTFNGEHSGHILEVGRLNLAEPEKNMIAAQLQLGLTKDRILKNIREKFDKDQRLSYTTRKDLHNISAAYGIDCADTYDQNDAVAVAVNSIRDSSAEFVSVNDKHMENARSKSVDVRKQDIHAQYQGLLTQILQSTSDEELDQYAQSFSELQISLAAIRARKQILPPSKRGVRIPRKKY